MKYTLHRALALKKSTEDRIIAEISNATFIEIKQGKKNKINGIPVEEVKKRILESYQKICQLISNYSKIKNAILRSNAGLTHDTTAILNTVKVCDKEYTIAELISASDEIYGNRKHPNAFWAELLTKMKRDYSEAIRRVERQHEKVEQDIKEYLSKAAASDKGMTNEEISKRSNLFHEDGDYTLIDPLDLKKTIDRLDNKIKNFRIEADATLSEQNAVNMIDVDLTTVE